MAGYTRIPGIDEDYQFPPEMREAIGKYPEVQQAIADSETVREGVANSEVLHQAISDSVPIREAFVGSPQLSARFEDELDPYDTRLTRVEDPALYDSRYLERWLFSDPRLPNPANDSDKLEACIAFVASKGGGILVIDRDIVLTRTTNWDIANVSLDFSGHTIDASSITNSVALSTLNSHTTLTVLTHRFISNFKLYGPGRTSSGSVGMRLIDDDTAGHLRDITVSNGEIRGFAVGTSFASNSYLIRHHTMQYRSNGIHVRVEATGDPVVNTNYGENYTFLTSTFGSQCDVAFDVDRPHCDIYTFGCSFDFLAKVCVVRNGQLNLIESHVELSGGLGQSVFQIADGTFNKLRIIGGRIMQTGGASPTNWFYSGSPYGGGGIELSGVSLEFVDSTDAYLCGGPGPFRTSNLSFPTGTEGSGYGAKVILGSKAQNLLRDPGFTESSQIDFKILSSAGTITSALDSADVQILNDGQTLRFYKKTTAAARVVVSIPAELYTYYAYAFQVYSQSGGGTLGMIERWVYGERYDSNGLLIPIKTLAKPEVTAGISSLVGNLRAEKGTSATWSRERPHWATHYQVVLNLSALTVGNYRINSFVITGV